MFPNVVAEHWFVSFHQWTVLIRSTDDFQLAAFNDEPNPATAKASETGCFKFFFEGVEAAESRFDVIRQNMVWFACPPPLFRTAPRTSSGTAFKLLISSSTGFFSRSVLPAMALF